ncbi:hypothetical protein AX760_03110 [Pararhizobium antarcticum]|uniref:Uncharacterized protein n=1 Tax=Pararhizobium antarcticum TaxID=1798805 RepID=A0A657LTJ7_9HYPH|nr:hypothetical protein AX761_20540 [Rhizobium sp. 58]OJF96864.1 hypothetical protein AX760_03110 [Pararhizobium antarcticum]
MFGLNSCEKDQNVTKLEQIEESFLELDSGDLEQFAAWFHKLEAERWDVQFAADVKTGALDDVANEAIVEFNSGRSRAL